MDMEGRVVVHMAVDAVEEQVREEDKAAAIMGADIRIQLMDTGIVDMEVEVEASMIALLGQTKFQQL